MSGHARELFYGKMNKKITTSIYFQFFYPIYLLSVKCSNRTYLITLYMSTQKPFTLTSSRKRMIGNCLVSGMLLNGFSGYAQQSLVVTGGDALPLEGA